MHTQGDELSASLSLARLLEGVFPEEYEKRRVEFSAEESDATPPACGAQEVQMPLFILDSMLPRQRLQLNVFEQRYLLMVRRCLDGSRAFGMVGHARSRAGHWAFMRFGVEVEIVEHEQQQDGRLHIEVLARRRFEISGDTWLQDGYNMANVQWIAPSSDASENTPQVLEAAESLAELVQEWQALVLSGRWQRFPGQLGRCLADLGPLPPATDGATAAERAFWVGALINPLPPLGVAPEIRPALLASTDSLDAVLIATRGISQSIEYLTPSPRVVWLRQQIAAIWRQAQTLGRAAMMVCGAGGGEQAIVVLACKLVLVISVVMLAGTASQDQVRAGQSVVASKTVEEL